MGCNRAHDDGGGPRSAGQGEADLRAVVTRAVSAQLLLALSRREREEAAQPAKGEGGNLEGFDEAVAP
ncbi:hypothetical protein SPHINGO361_70088 [Sphingomonas sp. EC-HK361]|nr:hypothetical protein SPHINGO361_70088 [Sphingomonas sp. EC-HK361]